jgi:hypothetical protein
MTLYGLEDEFDDATVESIQRALTTAGEEQRGMAMIFSIVSVLQVSMFDLSSFNFSSWEPFSETLLFLS